MTARPSVFIATHYILANISEIIKTAGEGNTLVPEVFFRRGETRQKEAARDLSSRTQGREGMGDVQTFLKEYQTISNYLVNTQSSNDKPKFHL